MKYKVYVDCDRNGGDDDVFTFTCTVDAATKEAAMKAGEAEAVKAHGEDNVLGAYDAKEVKA
jgi:hypothetical protein